ncbi:hypothetical protein MMC13_006714 [Lambiella insularis]|nr:hypothetical protein [Lambiella insularis]
MSVEDIVIDTFLRSVLDTSTKTRQQCIALLDQSGTASVSARDTPPLDTELDLSKEQKLLYSYLAQLRGSNRTAWFAVRQTKQATAEARSEIDRLHLQLQNLYYEQRHLRGEISACESYDHKYQRLPLIPVDEFLKQFPEHEQDDEHALMIARIGHEHAEREALEQARQSLLKKKQGLIADNKKRKDDLASLDKDLEKFIDAAKPIQKIFEKEY